MEETLFENTTAITEPLMKSAAGVVSGKMKIKYMGMAAAFVVVGILNLVDNSYGWYGYALAAVAGVVLPIAVMYSFKSRVARQGKALYNVFMQSSKNPGFLNYVFTEENFGFSDGKRHGYGQVVKAVEQETAWVILMQSTVLAIAKDSFTKGDAESFARFIKGKVPKGRA